MKSICYDVIIPAFNAAETISDAVASINKQSIPPERIFIIDDGSTDATLAIATALLGPVTVIGQKNQGPATATNAGLAHTTAPFICFLDADDVWLPNKSEIQLDHLVKRPEVAGVFSCSLTFKGSLQAAELRERAENWGRSTLMIRNEAAREIGYMLTGMPGNVGEVIDWIARGRHLGQRFDMLQDVLAWRRIRPGSLSYTLNDDKRRGYLLAARRSIERRRKDTDS